MAQTIEELQKDISFAVRRVVKDMPAKPHTLAEFDSLVDLELGQRAFIRLHEVLAELRQRGIEV